MFGVAKEVINKRAPGLIYAWAMQHGWPGGALFQGALQ